MHRAEILDKIAESNPDGLHQELAEFKNSVRNVVADMRKFMFDLRPDSLDDLGLVATMRRYTNSFGDRTGVTCPFNMTGEDRRLPPSLEETLFRIMQEALTNVQRHAAAKTVEVTLNVTGEHATARPRRRIRIRPRPLPGAGRSPQARGARDDRARSRPGRPPGGVEPARAGHGDPRRVRTPALVPLPGCQAGHPGIVCNLPIVS